LYRFGAIKFGDAGGCRAARAVRRDRVSAYMEKGLLALYGQALAAMVSV